MPNWCNNNITLTHPDPAMIRRAKTAFAEGRLLDEFIPCPQELRDTVAGSHSDPVKKAALEAQEKANVAKYGYKNWYDFCTNEWGTKWDIGGADDTLFSPMEETPDSIMEASFESAWAPPCDAYEKLQGVGFSIKASYYEPGMNFCGMWVDGDDDHYDLCDMTSAEVKALIPHELDELMGISENMEEIEAMEAEG